MIDIHSHILPGIDDGPDSMEESIAMARMAEKEGIKSIIATPHSGAGEYRTNPPQVRKAVSELNERLELEGVAIQIFPGMEIRVTPRVVDLLLARDLLTLNETPYVLLELHPLQVLAGMENLLHSLIEKGFCPILAHPEKNNAIQGDPTRFIDMFCRLPLGSFLIQITADSLAGDSDLTSLSTAQFLLKSRAVHFIASDAHSVAARPPRLKDAVEIATALVGPDLARKLVFDWPLAVLRGEAIAPEAPASTPRPKWWSFLPWFRR